MMNRYRKSRVGYTLLELLLALGLTVIVISTIASAIHVNLFSLARAQAKIERKQVARSVLAMIGNDIRAAVQFKAADYSGLEDLLLSQQLAAGVQPVDEEDEGEEGEEGDNSAVLEDADSDFVEDELIEEDVDDWSVGLIGDSNYIWLDISRLPRIDQYHPLIRSVQDDVRTASDIKQVVYYVGSLEGNSAGASQSRDQNNSSGLMRDEIDRAVAFYQGGFDPTAPKEYSQLVAPEVVQIGFRFFDGSDWLTSWDSVENEGFPTAVEINIVLDSNPLADRGDDPGSLSVNDDGRYENYRSVVNLPLAEIPEEDDSDG